MLERRALLWGAGALLVFGLSGCAESRNLEADESAQLVEGAQTSPGDNVQQEETAMQVSVIVNDVPFTATIEDTAAGCGLLSRLPLTLSMDELHGNEKYCYTGEPFDGEQSVPGTIEAGDLMVFGSDCLVLFYETFSNGGWSYARVGKIDDPTGLAEACGSRAATVAFKSLA